jgi:lipopolysaccharide transport system permease protein
LDSHAVRHGFDVIAVLLAKELKIRYKSTALGYLWSVAYPLALAFVFNFVFKLVIRIPVENYALFVVIGLFPWQWFQNSVIGANGFFLANGSLIKKVSFPRALLVLTGVLNDLVHFLASLPVIFGFLLWSGTLPSISWLWQIPLLLVIQFGVTYGMSLAVATANLFLRDLERLLGIGTLLWLYLTPVLYPWDMVPEDYRWTFWLNPMTLLVQSWRDVLMTGTLDPGIVAGAAGWACVILLTGQLIYASFERRFAEVV